MSQQGLTKVKLKVPPEVARIVAPGAPRELQISAARGALPLSGKDLLTVLFFLCNSQDLEVKRQAVKTLKDHPSSILCESLHDLELPSQFLELLARARLDDHTLMSKVIIHPAVQNATLLYLAEKGDLSVLRTLAGHQRLVEENPAIATAIIANPNAERSLKLQLGWREPELEGAEKQAGDQVLAGLDEEQQADDVDIDALMDEVERDGASKYQVAMDLRVAEKIKIGLTGDKEWRSILMKDSNKLVQGAVLKNPRITDGEVIMVAKNKSTSDEMIRLILLNKDWMKLYEIKKALATHPKTPMPRAIRLISMLNTKDLKDLMRSKNVSTVIAMTAFKEYESRKKRGGG